MTARITNAKIIEALRETHGNFMLSAKKLGCSRVMIWSRVKKSEELQKVVEDEREGMVDIAEGALYSSLLNQDPWAVVHLKDTWKRSRVCRKAAAGDHREGRRAYPPIPHDR